MNTEITIFTGDSVAIEFKTKKGDVRYTSPEGALFQGGAALVALRDRVSVEAARKAANGKYRAAADILSAAFPGVSRSFERLIGPAWTNKSSMALFLSAIEKTAEEKEKIGKKITAKEREGLALVRALRSIPSLARSEEEEKNRAIEGTITSKEELDPSLARSEEEEKNRAIEGTVANKEDNPKRKRTRKTPTSLTD